MLSNRSAISALVILVAASAIAQESTLKIQLPSDGDWIVWTGASVGKAPPSDAGAAAEIPASGLTPETLLLALNQKVNRLVAVPYSTVSKSNLWTVAPNYKYMGWVNVRVEHDGKPVSAASVIASTPSGPREMILSPDSRGVAKLFGLPFGQVKISAKYSFNGETKTTTIQLLDLKASGNDKPEVLIAIPDAVETLTAEAGKKETAKAPAAEEKSTSVVGKLLGYILGLGIAVGLGYAILKMVQKNEKVISEGLGKLGVHVPTDEELKGDQGNDPVIPIKPAPVQPIILDPSDAIDLSPQTPINQISAAPAQPQLVGLSGTLLISEGEGIVGRETTAGYPVPEDSVSRQHARLVRTGDTVVLTDLGSTNKTYVNGVPITSDTVLKPGDTVQFGAVQFRFEA